MRVNQVSQQNINFKATLLRGLQDAREKAFQEADKNGKMQEFRKYDKTISENFKSGVLFYDVRALPNWPTRDVLFEQPGLRKKLLILNMDQCGLDKMKQIADALTKLREYLSNSKTLLDENKA